MEQILKKLKALKGMLLLNSDGLLYILNDYSLVEEELVRVRTTWFYKEVKPFTYIKQLNISKHGCIDYNHTEQSQQAMRRQLNELIEDRNRYLHMSKSLTEYGYTIKRK